MHKVTAMAAVTASHGSVYLPKYAVYRGYRAGKRDFPGLLQDLHQDVGQKAEAVGVAGVWPGSWQKMESNYPSQLSRTDGEK